MTSSPNGAKLSETITDSEAFIVGIDPDSKKSGVAVWRRKDRRYVLHNFKFFGLFEFLQNSKAEIRLVLIEAGWLNKSTWHGVRRKGGAISARIGKNVGANHETGKKITEMCAFLKIPFELVRPTQSKLSAEAFEKFTGILERTNQEQRDAFMLVFGR